MDANDSWQRRVERFVAAYAALIATVALGWQVFDSLGDKAQLRVECASRALVHAQVDNPSQLQIEVLLRIVNFGRRAATVYRVHKPELRFDRDVRTEYDQVAAAMLATELPMRLEPGDARELWLPINLFDDAGLVPGGNSHPPCSVQLETTSGVISGRSVIDANVMNPTGRAPSGSRSQ